MVNFLYFALVLGFSMFLMHPVFLGISLICAVCYSVYLNGRKAFRFQMVYLLPLLLLTAVLNPVFNHEGVTVLTYFRDGNPLTLESIFYGAARLIFNIFRPSEGGRSVSGAFWAARLILCYACCRWY